MANFFFRHPQKLSESVSWLLDDDDDDDGTDFLAEKGRSESQAPLVPRRTAGQTDKWPDLDQIANNYNKR